jgi:hypothetical protein
MTTRLDPERLNFSFNFVPNLGSPALCSPLSKGNDMTISDNGISIFSIKIANSRLRLSAAYNHTVRHR